MILRSCMMPLFSIFFEPRILDAFFVWKNQTNIFFYATRKFQSMALSKWTMNHQRKLAVTVLAANIVGSTLPSECSLLFENLHRCKNTLLMLYPKTRVWLAMFTNCHFSTTGFMITSKMIKVSHYFWSITSSLGEALWKEIITMYWKCVLDGSRETHYKKIHFWNLKNRAYYFGRDEVNMQCGLCSQGKNIWSFALLYDGVFAGLKNTSIFLAGHGENIQVMHEREIPRSPPISYLWQNQIHS